MLREDRIVEAFIHTLAAAREQRLLNRLMRSEPDMLLPALTTDGGPPRWVARLVLSYLLTPGLETPREARRFARRCIAPLMTG